MSTIPHAQRLAFIMPKKTASEMSTVGVKGPDDVVVVAALRTAIGKAKRGKFKNTTPDLMLKAVLEGVMKESGIKHDEVQDIVVGNVQMGGSFAGPARMVQLTSGFSEKTPLMAVNRQCSSGLQAVANVAYAIKGGSIDVGIGAGVESMTTGGGVADKPKGPPKAPVMDLDNIFANDLARQCLMGMGQTAEVVAERYGITRAQQDQMASESNEKALHAIKTGLFKREIVPMTVKSVDADGNESMVLMDTDEGPREGSTPERLGKLRTVFKKAEEGGSVTAGNASQNSDGAAAVLMMRRSKAKELGLTVLGTMRGYKVVGVRPDEMGIGPAAAIPAVLDQTKLNVGDIDAYEINEAFASQAVYCVEKLGIDMKKVNPNGGAIALGHPLGCTGARQVATLLHHLHHIKKPLGCISMCIGTGMGAAAIFEAENL